LKRNYGSKKKALNMGRKKKLQEIDLSQEEAKAGQ